MPLKCQRAGQDINACDIETEEDWATLRKAAAAAQDLTMPCCGAGVVLRTSKLGTRHFAHAKRGLCESGPESAEHMLAKFIVFQAIKSTAWTPLLEQAGITADGEAWRADVLAAKGSSKVAFEVQWSRQEGEETLRRQSRYTAAKVRGLWLFRQKDFPSSKATPAFRLVHREDSKDFEVHLPSPEHSSSWSARRGEDARLWAQRIPLHRFVAGALEGRLRFAPAIDVAMPVVVYGTSIQCWRCKKDTTVVTELRFSAGRLFPGCSDIPVSIYDLGEVPNGPAEVTELLPASLLGRYGVGAIKPRHSRTEGNSYVSNGCVHCDSLQGRFYEHEYAFDATPLFEVEGRLKDEWSTALESAQPHIEVWWFDEA